MVGESGISTGGQTKAYRSLAIAGQPEATQQEIIKINTQARHLAPQIALLVPILAGLTGFGISFRMKRLPDPKQSGDAEQLVLG
jgi:hypothetical protein